MARSRLWIGLSMAALLSLSGCDASSSFSTATPTENPSSSALPIQKANYRIAYLANPGVYPAADFAQTQRYLSDHALDNAMVLESQYVFKAQLDRIEQDDPDVLVINGNLTAHGEQEGHEIVAQALEDFKSDMAKKGKDVPIVLTPGSMDFATHFAYDYQNDRPAKAMDLSYFSGLYSPSVFSSPDIVSRFDQSAWSVHDPDHIGMLSYAVRVKGKGDVPGITFVSLDGNDYGTLPLGKDLGNPLFAPSGMVSDALKGWLRQEIGNAKERGDSVIVTSSYAFLASYDSQAQNNPDTLYDGGDGLAEELSDLGVGFALVSGDSSFSVKGRDSAAGNRFYQIQNGAGNAYPAGYRLIDATAALQGKSTGLQLSAKTQLLTRQAGIKFEHDGELISIANLRNYSKDLLPTATDIPYYALKLKNAVNALFDYGSLKDWLRKIGVNSDKAGEILSGLLTSTGSLTIPLSSFGRIVLAYGDFSEDEGYPSTRFEPGEKVFRIQANVSIGSLALTGVTLYANEDTVNALINDVLDDAQRLLLDDPKPWANVGQLAKDRIFSKEIDRSYTAMEFFSELFNLHADGDMKENLKGWVKTVYEDIDKGFSSEILYGPDGLGVTAIDALPDAIYGFIGDWRLHPEVFDAIQSATDDRSKAIWGAAKTVLTAYANPFSASKAEIGPALVKDLRRQLLEIKDGMRTDGVVYDAGRRINQELEGYLSFANQEAFGIGSDNDFSAIVGSGLFR